MTPLTLKLVPFGTHPNILTPRSQNGMCPFYLTSVVSVTPIRHPGDRMCARCGGKRRLRL